MTPGAGQGLDFDAEVSRGGFTLRVALAAPPGEVLGILGPNGSGNSTLLSAVAGLLPVSAGRILVDGQVVDDAHTGEFLEAAQRPVGFVFQNYRLFPHMNVLDNVTLGPRKALGLSRAEAEREATALLGRFGESAKLIAGGHSLLPLMKLRLAEPRHLVDIRRIPALSGVREEEGALIIGAATPHQVLEHSPIVQKRLPIVSEAAAQIGDVQVRNMGTIGGSLAHADPAADLPAVMLALGAELTAVGPKGKRTVPVDGFFVKLFTTTLDPGEVLTEVRIPLPETEEVPAESSASPSG